jgi:polyhydroxyalkanoate synthesis repressor PhaR
MEIHMATVRTVRKYPNRRLYDTVESRYVTLVDMRRLIRDNIEFVVVDRKTDEDITNPVLLQVIAEEERGEAPLLSRGLLLKLIRAYGSPIQDAISSYLEQSLTMLLAAKDGKRAARDEKRDSSDLSAQSGADRNFERWRALQDEIYRALANGGNGRAERLHEETANE